MDWSPIILSMKTAAVAIAITFVLGILGAWLVFSRKSRTAKIIWDVIFTLPLVLPPTVAGFFLLCIFGAKHTVGAFFLAHFDVRIAFTWPATVIAAVVMSFPMMYRSARGAFAQVDGNLIAVARTLGMSERQILWKIVIQNSIPGLVSGGILAYARGLGEFGATAMLAGNIPGRTQTLPMAVYSQVAAGDYTTAGWYVAMLLVLAFAAIVLLNVVEYKASRRMANG